MYLLQGRHEADPPPHHCRVGRLSYQTSFMAHCLGVMEMHQVFWALEMQVQLRHDPSSPGASDICWGGRKKHRNMESKWSQTLGLEGQLKTQWRSDHFSLVGGGGRESPERLLRGRFELSGAYQVDQGESERGEQ